MLTDNSFSGFKSVIGLILGLCLKPAGYWSEPTGFVYGNETFPAPNRQAVEERSLAFRLEANHYARSTLPVCREIILTFEY